MKEHEIFLPEEFNIPFNYTETGSTYMENAMGKAFALFNKTGNPVIADDSGLSIPALGGEPGIYSARYGSGNSGIPLSDADRNSFLLKKMEGINERKAFFVCCMVLILNEYQFYIVQEIVHGEIAKSASGKGGFGYDPVFYLKEYKKTAAEIPESEKNRISHRGKAGTRINSIIKTL